MTGAGSPAGTRDRLVHAALHVIGTHGVAGLTNRRVAAEAGVSLGSLTYHFATQTDLLRECLLVFVRDEAVRITTVADSLATSVTSMADAAAAAERALTEIALGPEEIGVLEVYLQSARDPGLREAVATCFAAYDHAARSILGMLAVPDADRLAPQVVALVLGTQVRRLATGAADAGGIAGGLLRLISGAA